jgi:hypothetical protein
VFAADVGSAPSKVRLAPVTRRDETVTGAYCASGHFTDSAQPRCLFCTSEVDLTTFGEGVRPVMARLEFSDGRIVPVVGTVVIGRKLTGLSAGEEPVEFPDDLMMSRRHAEVRVSDWRLVVIDLQSVNGTSVSTETGRSTTVRPHFEMPLDRGSTVRCGGISFVVQAPNEPFKHQ